MDLQVYRLVLSLVVESSVELLMQLNQKIRIFYSMTFLCFFTGVAATEFAIKSQNQTTTTIFNDVNSAVDINNNPIVLINNVPDPIVDYTADGPSVNTLKFLSGVPKVGKISKVEITNALDMNQRATNRSSSMILVKLTLLQSTKCTWISVCT